MPTESTLTREQGKDYTLETTEHGKSYEIAFINNYLIKEYRDVLERFIEQYRLYSNDIDNNVIQHIIDGKKISNVVLAIVDHKLEAAAVVTAYEDKTIVIEAASGWFTDIKDIKVLYKLFSTTCHNLGIEEIKFSGRKGWAKLLKHYKPDIKYHYTLRAQSWVAVEKAEGVGVDKLPHKE